MFCFIVLHYFVTEDTIECVDSILNNINGDFRIVIVDNCSPNNSYEELNKKYKMNKKVILIKSKKNLGFAKGNNYGYNYAKNILKASYIACINNDTILNQKNFIEICKSLFINEKYFVLGPDIISTKDGFHQNPLSPKGVIETKDLLWGIIKCFLLIIKSYLGIEPTAIDTSYLTRDYLNKQYNIKLHGAALIFSPLYVKRYEGFYEKTFMYGEEDILFYIAQRDNFKLLYDPSVQIMHKEFSSTNASNKKKGQALRFRYKNVIISNMVFLHLKMKDYIKSKYNNWKS